MLVWIEISLHWKKKSSELTESITKSNLLPSSLNDENFVQIGNACVVVNAFHNNKHSVTRYLSLHESPLEYQHLIVPFLYGCRAVDY
jgi:hypothetical protein